MAGWAANNKYTLLGGLRSSAQMFSYELALGLSLDRRDPARRLVPHSATSCAARTAGSCTGTSFSSRSRFLIFLVAGTAEVNRTPFDLPEAETELVAGFHTEYSSMRFALLQMAEYVHMITVSAVGANLFFGGWHVARPLPARLAAVVRRSSSSAFLFFFIWLRGTLPRFRYDQLMDFGWKVLVPLATLNLLVTAARGGRVSA